MNSEKERSSLLNRAGKTLLRHITPQIYAQRSIREWPAWLEKVHEVSVPRAVIPQPEVTSSGGANINIVLRLLDQTRSLPGAIADCGVFRGASLVAIGIYLRQNGIEKTIYGFDSFAGFDESINFDMGLSGVHEKEKVLGGFSNTSIELVLAKVRAFKLNKIRLVPGYFKDAFPKVPADVQFCFAHLDVNLYTSYKECMEFCYPRLVKGGIILLDEYNDPPWPGCKEALDEFLADKPEKLQAAVSENYQKFYMVKQ